MNFNGTFEVKVPKDKVFDVLMTPEKLTSCIPGFKSLSVTSPNEFSVVVRAGVAFIKGDFNIKFKVVESVPSDHAKLVGNGTGLGGTLDIEAVMDLSENDGLTTMSWTADTKIGGKLGSIGQRVIGSQSRKMIDELFSSLKDKLLSE